MAGEPLRPPLSLRSAAPEAGAFARDRTAADRLDHGRGARRLGADRRPLARLERARRLPRRILHYARDGAHGAGIGIFRLARNGARRRTRFASGAAVRAAMGTQAAPGRAAGAYNSGLGAIGGRR